MLLKLCFNLLRYLFQVLLINTGVGDKLINERTTDLLAEEPDNTGYVPPVRLAQAVKWMSATAAEADGGSACPPGTLVVVNHFKPVRQVTWHGKGDYFASVLPEGAQRSVVIHQLSKWRSQLPFSKAKGLTPLLTLTSLLKPSPLRGC